MTSVRDVNLISFVRTLCGSNPLRLDCFSLNMDHSLARGRRPLEPFGLVGVVTLQGIAEALLTSNDTVALFVISS